MDALSAAQQIAKAPSETEALRMLADVVVTGDASRYAPTAKPNTHWRVLTRKDQA